MADQVSEEYTKEELEAREISKNLREMNIRVITDKSTGIQLTMLLAYIRNIIKNDTPAEIKLSVGKKIQSGRFSFTVNDSEIKDLKYCDSAEIN